MVPQECVVLVANKKLLERIWREDGHKCKWVVEAPSCTETTISLLDGGVLGEKCVPVWYRVLA